jgi:hypothetical protein
MIWAFKPLSVVTSDCFFDSSLYAQVPEHWLLRDVDPSAEPVVRRTGVMKYLGSAIQTTREIVRNHDGGSAHLARRSFCWHNHLGATPWLWLSYNLRMTASNSDHPLRRREILCSNTLLFSRGSRNPCEPSRHL